MVPWMRGPPGMGISIRESPVSTNKLPDPAEGNEIVNAHILHEINDRLPVGYEDKFTVTNIMLRA